jgi:uncharacterized protein YjbI with pentapeptide repeats
MDEDDVLLKEAEEIFLNKISDRDMTLCLGNLRKVVQGLWAIDAPRIIQDYTDHGIEHSIRIMEKLKLILGDNVDRLSVEELFLLLVAIYLHDIGMQCDISKYPEIKENAEKKFGAKFSVEFTAITANNYSKEEQNSIRTNHHFLTVAWIDYAFLSGKTSLGVAISGIDRSLIRDVIDICQYHSKLPIEKCPEFCSIRPIRKQLIAALLRFGDELDIDRDRVQFNTVQSFSFDESNSSFWWLHDRTYVNVDKSEVVIKIELHPADKDQYEKLIYDAYIGGFRKKNQAVLNVLVKNGIPLIVSDKSTVVANEYVKKIPESTISFLLKKDDETREPLWQLCNEITLWVKSIRYQVTEATKIDKRTIEMVATLNEGSIFQKVLVRCVEGEITYQDYLHMDGSLSRNISQGWIISDRRISLKAIESCLSDSGIELFNLAGFLGNKIWKNYIYTIEEIVKKDKIAELYVDVDCCKRECDNGNSDVAEGSVTDYIDNWLYERGKVHISLLGDFGSGKTWFCRYYTQRQLKKYIQDPINERFPLLVTLRDFVKAITVKQLINDAFLERYKLPFVGSAYDIFQHMNKNGKIVLILDGFDEMARKSDYQTVVDNFWNLAELIDDNSKVILTSRTEYFRWANETEKIFSGKEYGRKTLVLKEPKFDVVYLNPFNETQITEVINKRYGDEGPKKVEVIFSNPKLAWMAKKPVLIELLFAALDDVKGEDIENIAQVYLYATNKLLLRNIDSKRTFTSTEDKVLFLCEIAWEMISSKELKIHYKSIPEKIKHYFSQKIQDNELDHWDYDLRSQTLLHNNTSGYYEFAHLSLAEYFVAYKFASEIGCLKKKFQTTYCDFDGRSCRSPYQVKSCLELTSSFGKTAFIKNSPIFSFLIELLDNNKASTVLLKLIEDTKNKSTDDVRFVGTNSAQLLCALEMPLEGSDFSHTVLPEIDFSFKDLTGCNFSGADLSGSVFTSVALKNASFESAKLNAVQLSNVYFENTNFDYTELCEAKFADPHFKTVVWLNNEQLIMTDQDGGVSFQVLNQKGLEKNRINNRSLDYCLTDGTNAILSSKDTVLFWSIDKKAVIHAMKCPESQINQMFISDSNKLFSTCHGGNSNFKIWDIEKKEILKDINIGTGWCNAAVFLEDEEYVLTTGYKAEIRKWHWKTQTSVLLHKIENAHNAFGLSFDQSFTKIAVTSFQKNKNENNSYVHIWDYPDFRPIFTINSDKTIRRFALSPDGNKLAILFRNQAKNKFSLKLFIFNGSSYKMTDNTNFQVDSYDFTREGQIVFSPDSNCIALCLGKVIIWECTNLKVPLHSIDARIDCRGLSVHGAKDSNTSVTWKVEKRKKKGTLLDYLRNRGASS